jgi:signal transduction histidine kinase
MLSNGCQLRDAESAIAVVRRNAELQARLIDDLLDMNRLMSGNFRLELGRVDVDALLNTTIQGLQPAAHGKGVQLVPSNDGWTGEVMGDARRLQQVLWNLVHNAIKFTPAGGRVEVRLQGMGGALAVTVTDTGCGIGADFLPHVFERFRQENCQIAGRTAGLGLGLSIAKYLVELHGGTIDAWSPGPGAGATFQVRIPATSAPVTGRHDYDPRASGLQAYSPPVV